MSIWSQIRGQWQRTRPFDLIRIDGHTVSRVLKQRSWPVWAGVASLLAATFASSAADAQSRTIKLLNVHTNERIEIVYKRGNSYDAAALKKINYIMRDWRKNQPTKMNPKVLDVVWEAYRNTGASGYIHVICGYRSPATNSMLRSRSKGVAKNSQHTLGNAIDFFIPGVKLKTLRNAGLALQAGGVGYYPSSGSPFVHMDVGNVRHWGPISDSEVASAVRSGKRFQSGGGSVVAFAESGKKSGGLLSRLFGGGADEEEDIAESEAPAKKAVAKKPVVKPAVAAAPKNDLPGITILSPGQAKPAPVRTPEPEVVEQPEPVVETPETIIAALPARKVPMPGFAPRPQADIGPQPSETIAESIQDPATAVPVDGTATGGTEVALGIPLPSWRPDHQAAPAADSSALLAMASVETTETADAVYPVPGVRPAKAPAVTGAIVVPSPKQARVSAPKTVTTAKTARPGPLDSKPDPKPVIVAAAPDAARWALDKNYVAKATKRTTAPSFVYNVRAKPLEVYTAGFQQGDDGGSINRFTGKAVKFLTVAKFSK